MGLDVSAEREVLAGDTTSEAPKNPVSSLWEDRGLVASPDASPLLRLVSSEMSAGLLVLEAGELRLAGESWDLGLFLPGAGEEVGGGSLTTGVRFRSTGGRSFTVTDLYLSPGPGCF